MSITYVATLCVMLTMDLILALLGLIFGTYLPLVCLSSTLRTWSHHVLKPKCPVITYPCTVYSVEFVNQSNDVLHMIIQCIKLHREMLTENRNEDEYSSMTRAEMSSVSRKCYTGIWRNIGDIDNVPSIPDIPPLRHGELVGTNIIYLTNECPRPRRDQYIIQSPCVEGHWSRDEILSAEHTVVYQMNNYIWYNACSDTQCAFCEEYTASQFYEDD